MVKRRSQVEIKTGAEGNLVDAIWNWFVSMRTGLLLLGLIAGLSIIGTLIPQDDLGPNANPIFRLLGFYDVYHTIWFRTLLGLFCINITLCSWQRFPILWKNTFSTPALPQRDVLKHLPVAGKVKTSAELITAMESAEQILKNAGFRLRWYGNGTDSFFADKGRLAPWGTLAVHLSLLIIVCGALLGNFKGFSTTIPIPVGESVTISPQEYPVKKSFTVRINDFKTEYYSQGGVADWISDVSIVVQDKEIVRQDLKVNHPLDFEGVRFYQSSYGQAIKMAFYDTAGQLVQERAVPEGEVFNIGKEGLAVRPARYIPDFDQTRPMVSKSPEPKNPRILYIVYDKGKELDWGAARPGEIIMVKDQGGVVFQKAIPYTGLQVKRDPGLSVVIGGFILMTVGFFISLYSRSIQLWFTFSQQGTGTLVEWGGKTPRSQMEVENLQETLAGALPLVGKE